MKPRVRPIQNLYFRWGHSHGLNSQDVARILQDNGLIEILNAGTHYQETPLARKVPKENFEALITTLLGGTLEKRS
jgi:hypothetical protein